MLTDDGTTMTLTVGGFTFTCTGVDAENRRQATARLNAIRQAHLDKMQAKPTATKRSN